MADPYNDLRAELQRLIAPAEAAFARANDLDSQARRLHEERGVKAEMYGLSSLRGAHTLALGTARQEAHGVVIGLRRILDREGNGPCALCGDQIPLDELVTGQASGPRGVVLHDGEVAHRECFEEAKGRMA